MRDALLVLLILAVISAAMYGQSVAYSSFVVEYSDSLKIPLSVVWNLSSSDIGKVKRSASMKFYTDTIDGRPTASPSDYTHSGYDRGHMCPAADRSASRRLMAETFTMSNICPQTPDLNRKWWRYLEDSCRTWARRGKKLKIQAVPVFWHAPVLRLGRSRVAVPHGFVKTIRDQLTDSIIHQQYFENR